MGFDNIGIALTLTLFAGLSTGIGSLIALLSKKTNAAFLSVALGLSAGVMIYISLVEMVPHSIQILTSSWGGWSQWIVLFAFFFGVGITALIDAVIPNAQNPHELHKDAGELKELKSERGDKQKLLRMGFFTAGALALHNFPEGLATFVSAMQMPTIAISVAIAVAIHNIPEGIAVSVPIFYATGSRKKAFIYSFLSGFAEPVGALIGYAFLFPFLSDTLFGVVMTVVAGIMVYISFDELLPAAEEYGEHHLALLGVFIGMFIMAFSLACF